MCHSSGKSMKLFIIINFNFAFFTFNRVNQIYKSLMLIQRGYTRFCVRLHIICIIVANGNA